MTSGAGSSLHMEQVSLVATVKVASVSADEFHEITMKQTTIASFQILPYSFIVIFPPHSTLYNFWSWNRVVKYPKNEQISPQLKWYN